MIRFKVIRFLPVLLLTVFSITSCSGPKTVCTVNCGGSGTATVSLTLVSDTPPVSPSLLSYKVTVLQVTLTPSTGTAFTFTPNPAPVIELMRLQSDSAFLGTLLNVPVGTYSSITVSLGSPQITFLNNTSATIINASSASGSCTVGAICTISPNAAGLPKVSTTPFPITVSANAKIGLGIDFSLSNSITITGGTMTVTFTPATAGVNVLSAFNLPRANANLSTNQLELIEDFTGVISLSGNNVTITSPKRGTLTATNTSSSFFDVSPDGNTCKTPATFSCVAAGQIASVDAFLNSDGTVSLKEYEPLVATQQDLVEGIVYLIPSLTQFDIVVTDKTQAATASLIGGLNTGDLLTVNIPSPQPFFVDTKGLTVSSIAPGTIGNFTGQTSTSAIHLGQSVTVHITAFTAVIGSTPASVIADTVTLRWSRFATTVQTASSPAFTIIGLPSYFKFTQSSLFGVQTFTGTPGADGITNFDGVTDGNGLKPATPPVALRALFLENTANSANPVFFAAKVRQH